MEDQTLDEPRVLDAAMRICRSCGYGSTTFELVAAEVGAEPFDLRARWPTKSALLMEALRKEIGADLRYPDTGDFAADLRTQLHAIAKLFSDSAVAPFIARLLGEAQQGPAMVKEFQQYVYDPNREMARRRFLMAQACGQLRPDVDVDTAIDLTFAPFWFRLLLQSGAMTSEYVEAIVDMSLRALT
jgi:AcrR family transcriptional regulator